MNDGWCPICGGSLSASAAAHEFAPFCSARCRQIDLGRWLDDRYCIAGELPLESASDDGESSELAPEPPAC